MGVLQIIIIVFLGLIQVSLGNFDTLSSCELKIQRQCYQVSLLPSNHCFHNNTYKYARLRTGRSKRSQSLTDNYVQELSDSMDTLKYDFQKLEKKLVKEMRHLSKRVLRGARKMEVTVEESRKSGNGQKNSNKRCPNGFTAYDGWPSCYMFSSFNASWYDGRDYCAAFDADLITLNSIKEHNLIAFLLKQNKENREARGWWTSGTFYSKTKQWMWKSEAEIRPFSFIKWAANEPNDEHETDLQCVMMYTLDDHLWRDQICSDKYNFICEKKIE